MRRDIGGLAGQQFDVAIVGGGIHGAWIALRAARAGCRVALLERGDFGSATSANSLKILHGGLRYLQHLDLARMRTSTRSRREYARTLPHLFEPLSCVMPLEASGLRSPWMLGPALLANDGIAFDRNVGVAASARLPRGRLLSAARCRDEIGPLVQQRPWAGALWWDGIARDTARLVLETLHEAVVAGAVVANHASVERILHGGGRVHGIAFTDALTGRSHELVAAHVVNAAGPWAGALARNSGLPESDLPEAWIGAMNVVLRRSLGNTSAVALSSRNAMRDRDALWNRGARELFFVPWQGRTMIGTAYSRVESVEHGALGPPAGAVEDFMTHAAALAPAARITAADLALVHWGMMPLEQPGDSLPRKSPVILTDPALTGAAGLVTVIGEKLTSAPVVADRVLRHLAPRARALRPARPDHKQQPPVPNIPATARARLQSRYGWRWSSIASAATGQEGAFEQLHPETPVLRIELLHAVQEEMAQRLPDLLRRVGLLEAGSSSAPVVAAVAEWARSCGWDA